MPKINKSAKIKEGNRFFKNEKAVHQKSSQENR